MALKAVALKEAGTHPPTEGILARFAAVRSVGSLRDLDRIRKESPEVVLLDLNMARPEAQEVFRALQKPSRNPPLIICFDSRIPPARMIRQLKFLAAAGASPASRAPRLGRVFALLGISQEALSRILNVSARTLHRWLKGARPRRKPELDRLFELISSLGETLPNDAAITRYLHHPNPVFGGETPVALLLRGEFARVEADLQALEEGVYV
jgi:transcriptional regulator with XRE-family HTH domain